MAGEMAAKKQIAIGVTPLFIKRKWEVYYLGPWPLQNIQDVINTIPSEAFYKTVATHVNAVLEDGKMPPAEISSAILNFADDIRSGRQPVIRSGDYIAIQNYVKKAK